MLSSFKEGSQTQCPVRHKAEEKQEVRVSPSGGRTDGRGDMCVCVASERRHVTY